MLPLSLSYINCLWILVKGKEKTEEKLHLKGFFSYVECQIELLLSSVSTCDKVSKMSVCNTDKSSFSKMSTVHFDEHIAWRL